MENPAPDGSSGRAAAAEINICEDARLVKAPDVGNTP
jgi:hypothetical protein